MESKKNILILTVSIVIAAVSCRKEYSCENCIVSTEQDINLLDTAWRFNANNKLYYGYATLTFFNPDNNGIYMSGPTKNFPDTIMGIGIRIDPLFFDRNYSNLRLNSLGFVYGVTTGDTFTFLRFQSANNSVSGSIIQYDHASKIVEAVFSGSAIDEKGDNVIITNGRFKMKFK